MAAHHPDTFYIVWNPMGPTNPRYRHIEFHKASAEAERLALAHPGQDFYVMAASRVVRTTKPVEVIDFDLVIDPVPF